MQTLKRAFVASGKDNIAILAAGVAYYAFLAMVPLLAVVVLLYGLVADAQMVAGHIAALAERLPLAAAELVGEQLLAVVETSTTTKGLGLAIALVVSLFGARNAAGSVVTAVGLAFNDDCQRSLVRGTALAVAITLGAIVMLGVVVAALAATAAVAGALPTPDGISAGIGRLASYAVLTVMGAVGVAWIYRRSPASLTPKWRDALVGALVASLALAALTRLFGLYVANIDNFNATYGSLSAVIVLLTWLYLAAYVVLFGAEIAANRGADK